ncbi:anti-sigma factor [Streptomyces showdoensis]|uniref:Regulator of SigK n=1 Tax=Streptomyces showdoensis TaxID=68268 RepID=A0A2P2GLB0_STREW|nr:anti-sigma factor [Streptomyces showdoensis]KKZ71639.1 anti-sigma-K factor RskA [Streptomyces showdoensis]
MNQHRSDLHALAAAYALDALDPAERDDFAAHLPYCEDCRRDVAEFEATAARLAAATAQDPPPALKQRTMNAIDAVRQLPPRLPATDPAQAPAAGPARRSARALRRKAVPLALAASLAAAVSFAGLAAWQYQESQDARQQARQTARQLDAVSAVLAAPDARTVHGLATNGALTTVVSSDRQNKAVFTAAGLPVPAEGSTYQLWLDQDGTMRPAGFIRADGTVPLAGDPADATAVGLTLEPAGGSAQPTTQPLLLLALPA